MSTINHEVKNTDVIPFIESDVFNDNPDARFAVGILAVGDEILPGREREYHGYLKLRWNVYGPQTGQLSDEHRRPDGTEEDEDDARSVHFAVIENYLDPESEMTGQRVVGAIRRILKSEEDPRPLPIEDFYPDVFRANPAPLGSTEASRYICRHESPAQQGRLTPPLFSAYVSHVLTRGLGPTYGVVEPAVEALLAAKGVPTTRIADPVYVPQYLAENLGFLVDVPLLGQRLEARTPGILETMRKTEGDYAYFGRTASVSRALRPSEIIATGAVA